MSPHLTRKSLKLLVVCGCLLSIYAVCSVVVLWRDLSPHSPATNKKTVIFNFVSTTSTPSPTPYPNTPNPSSNSLNPSTTPITSTNSRNSLTPSDTPIPTNSPNPSAYTPQPTANPISDRITHTSPPPSPKLTHAELERTDSVIHTSATGRQFPFELNGEKCQLRIGSCVAMGCDGVVYSAFADCPQYTGVVKMALKLYRSKVTFLDKHIHADDELQKRLLLFSSNEHLRLQSLATTIARVRFPVGELRHSTGTCQMTDSIPKDCFHLSRQFWKDPQKIITASVMPFITGSSLRESKAREKVASIFHSFASTLHVLQQSGIYHCDLRLNHVVINGNQSAPSISIVDFGRTRTCTNRGGYINQKNNAHVQDCDVRDKIQMFIFGSMMLDFCRPRGSKLFNYAGPAYFHNAGICFSIKHIKKYLQEVHDQWHNVFEKRLSKGIQRCPHAKELLEVVNLAYSPIRKATEVNWEVIKSKLNRLIK